MMDIRVEVGYYEFVFADPNEAIAFAKTAAETIEDKERRIDVVIRLNGKEE